MATKKFIIEVEEGKTRCSNCFANDFGNCAIPLRLHKSLDCDKYNLATIKIIEYNESTCYDLQCLSRNPNKPIEYEK